MRDTEGWLYALQSLRNAGQVGIAAFLESLILDDRLDLSITTLCDGISALRKVLTSMDGWKIRLD